MLRNKFTKFTFALLSIVFALLLVACGGDKTSDSSSNNNSSSSEKKDKKDEVIELNVGNFLPSSHHFVYNVFEPWKELVEEETDGRIQVNLYHGGALGKGTSAYQDVKGGLYELGIAVASYYYDSDFFPYSIGNLPFAFDNPRDAANIMKDFAEKYDLYDIDGVVVVDSYATDPYILFSNEPVNKVEDVKNLKMRVSGKSETELVKELGGVPVSMEIGDTYEALQRNTVNTTFYTPIGGTQMKLFEPAPYVTDVKATTTITTPIMNEDFFNKLPEDLQQMFTDKFFPQLTEFFIRTFETELESSLVELAASVEKRGGEMITLEDDERQRFKQAGRKAWDIWIEDANERGYPGEQMVKDLFEIMEKHGAATPF